MRKIIRIEPLCLIAFVLGIIIGNGISRYIDNKSLAQDTMNLEERVEKLEQKE